MESAAYKGRRVLVTGHTGFKGSWLCEWLLLLGAEVHGFALEPPTTPSLFVQRNLMARLASDTRGDVRDLEALSACLQRVKPDFVFHLAGQPLVRESYRTPAETFAVNVMGVEPAGSDEEIALKGIEAMEDFYRRIHMPTNLRELGVHATDEDLVTMAHKCAVDVGGSMGSARVLEENDMLAIYRASM